jgi:starch synthase
VLNGIDVDLWNPETDPHLPYHYSHENLAGKYLTKKFFLEKIGMPYNPNRPLIGIVSRLVAQKGFDTVAEAIEELMKMDVQWVILGSGDERYERMFAALHHAQPHKVWTYIGFNNELAHLIEAASDMFLMPSHYEPCGLNQMYSLRYGTIPIVRKTGGLADTVHDWHEFQSLGSDKGNGFSFHDATGYALSTTVARAVDMFHNDKRTWHRMMMNGMNADFSWKASARKYVHLYEMAVRKRAR